MQRCCIDYEKALAGSCRVLIIRGPWWDSANSSDVAYIGDAGCPSFENFCMLYVTFNVDIEF